MEKLVFFVIFGAVGLINWIIRKNAEKPGRRPAPQVRATPQSRPRVQADLSSEEERLRKFMEALGVPTSAAPTPRVVRPQVVPRVVQPAVRKQIPRQVVVQRKSVAVPVSIPVPVPAVETYEAEAVTATKPEQTSYETSGQAPIVASDSSKTAAPTAAGVDFKSLLKSSSSIRTAVVLREILGPPRALQPF